MSSPPVSGSAAVLAMRRIASRERRDPGRSAPELSAAIHGVVSQVFVNLRETLGDDGCSALTARAFARCGWEHTAVATLRGATDCDLPLENVAASIEAHGAAPTATAVEALLVALCEILARIIGDDMAISIMDHRTPRVLDDDGGSA